MVSLECPRILGSIIRMIRATEAEAVRQARVRRVVCAALAAVVAGQATGVGGGPPATPDSGEVSVVCSVADRARQFITGLTESDFEILDNKRPQKVLRAEFGDRVPVRIALLIDGSGSSRGYLGKAQAEVLSFVKDTLLPRKYWFRIIGFSSATPPTTYVVGDLEGFAHAIRTFKPGGTTPLLDNVVLACGRLLEEEGPPPNRRVVLVLSDGDDNASRATLQRATEAAWTTGTVISTISTSRLDRTPPLRDVAELQVGAQTLNLLSSETGGAALVAADVKELRSCFGRFVDELQNQYVLSYNPEPPPGDARFHSIQVQVKGRKDVAVRAAKRYRPSN